MNGFDLVFLTPVFLLLAVAIGLGLWRGFKVAALTIGAGVIVLALGYAVYLAIYFANGGH